MTFHNLNENQKLLWIAETTGADNDEELTIAEVPTEEETTTKPAKKAKKAKKEKKPKTGGKKGRGMKTPGSGPRSLADKLRCSNCNNLMTQSVKLNFEEIPGKKLPKGMKSFGVAAGKVAGVLCDTCLALVESGTPITIKSAAIEQEDGTVTNIPVDGI